MPEEFGLGKANGPQPTLPFGHNRRTLVLMIYFNGQTEPDVFPGQDDRAVVRQRMARVHDYYLEASYGKLVLAGATGAAGGDVFGWLPVPIDHTCDGSRLRLQLLEELARLEPTVDPSAYEQFVVIAPFNCMWGGNATEGYVRVSSSFYAGAPLTVYVFAHEVGHHLFGLPHANFALCGEQSISSSCVERVFGDFYDVMGSTSDRDFPRHVCAYRKHLVGWLDVNRPLLALNPDDTPYSEGTYLLSPVESLLPGIKVLRIGRRVDRPVPSYLFVEFRQPLGFDQGMDEHGASNVFNGALIHSSPGTGGSGTWLLDATVGPDNPPDYRTSVLPPGSTFVDPETDIRITVQGIIQGATLAENLLAVTVLSGSTAASGSSWVTADYPLRRYKLYPPTPNPCNPSTLIAYDLPEAALVHLSIYDATGRLVRVLVDDRVQPQGRHRLRWDAKTDSGTPTPTGIYYVRLAADDHRATQRVVLLK